MEILGESVSNWSERFGSAFKALDNNMNAATLAISGISGNAVLNLVNPLENFRPKVSNCPAMW